MSDTDARLRQATGEIIAVPFSLSFSNMHDLPNVAALRFTRRDEVTKAWIGFAEVFRHPCGKVVVQTPESGCITLETLVRHIIPAMAHFDGVLLEVDAAWRQREYDARRLAEEKGGAQ